MIVSYGCVDSEQESNFYKLDKINNYIIETCITFDKRDLKITYVSNLE